MRIQNKCLIFTLISINVLVLCVMIRNSGTVKCGKYLNIFKRHDGTLKNGTTEINSKDNKIQEKQLNDTESDHVIEEASKERTETLRLVSQKHPDKCYSNCEYTGKINIQPEYKMFQSKFPIDSQIFKFLSDNQQETKHCDGNIQIFYDKFALLNNVTIKPGMWDHTKLSEAGKELHKFKNHKLRSDSGEILKPTIGLLSMKCSSSHMIEFNNRTLQNLSLLKSLSVINRNNHISSKQPLTVAILREEYANFYHMMLHMHNIFTTLMLLHRQPDDVQILIFDAHPQAEVDEIIQTLYGPVIRVTKLVQPLYVNHLLLCIEEKNSLLSQYSLDHLPHLDQFRTFFYNQHKLHENHYMECRKLTITFIWRRDKIWHPRNLRGLVERKVFNEAELLKAVYDKYPNFCVTGLLLESMPITEQLKFIRRTDILIGMHGAGLTHILFLPQTSGIVELFPQGFKNLHNYHTLFEAIARWRNLQYSYFENTKSENEMPNFFTRIDVDLFLTVLSDMVTKLCH